MNKAIKYKDNTYLDSSSIIHDKMILKTFLNDEKFNILWSGLFELNWIIEVPNYDLFDFLLLCVQTDYNRNGFIIVPRSEYNKQKNFCVILNGGHGDSTYAFNPSTLPNVSISRIVGSTTAYITSIIGIKL